MTIEKLDKDVNGKLHDLLDTFKFQHHRQELKDEKLVAFVHQNAEGGCYGYRMLLLMLMMM